MRFKLFLLSFIIVCFSQVSYAQHTEEEEAVLKVIKLETESFMKRDSITWKDQFIQNEKTTRVYSGFTFNQSHVGWNNFAPMMLEWIKTLEPSRYTDIQHINPIINITEDLAWVAFDQHLITPGIDSITPYGTREFRTLIKDMNRWKISSIISIDTANHINTKPQNMEDMFNFLGYTYLEDNMLDKAVEVFKLNVKLYPSAWNTYDSLGEAYALMGNKDLAIENYRKSIELNPENSHGKVMLAKLEND